MNLVNAYEDFLRDIDKFKVATVVPAEFLHWFHKGQQEWVDQRLEVFELTGKYDDDLSMIIYEKPYTSVNLQEQLVLPEDYYRTALAMIYFSFENDCEQTEQKQERVVRLTGDKKGLILSNPYYKPSRSRWYYHQVNGKKIWIYGDKTVSIEKFELTYCKTLPVFNVDDISNQTEVIWTMEQLKQIASKAAMLFLENKQSQRVSTFAQVNKIDQT